MRNSNQRIGLNDSILDVVTKLSDGNPGAVNVLMLIIKNNAAIDPDDFFGPLGPLLYLDTCGIYGPKIWMLFKDICGQDIVKTLAMLRACQLGLINSNDLIDAINGSRQVALPGEPDRKLNPDEVLEMVRKRLPKFAATVAEAPQEIGCPYSEPTTDENINDRVDAWHDAPVDTVAARLHVHLGMHESEYALWVQTGKLPEKEEVADGVEA